MAAEDKDHGRDGAAPRRTRLPAARRRETILQAAAEVFAEVGYHAAKVADVAARVGVTEPVIFQNFGSKAALFAAVVEHAAAEVRDSMDEVATGPGSAPGLLAHILAASAHRDPGHAGAAYGVLFADAAALAADPVLAEPARTAVRAIAAHLADLVRYAQANGGVRPDADSEAAAWLLLSVLSAQRLRAAAMPPTVEPAVTALVLGALAPPAADLSGRDQTPLDTPVNPVNASSA
jgi:AcrR family transcriptional regulator